MVTGLKPLPAATASPAQGSVPHRTSIWSGLSNLWNLRQLILLMVQRDLIGRYKGSLMGAFWPVINPLGHLLLYTFVFNIILQVRFSQNQSTANFAIYLMTGLVPWGAFSEAASRATTAILEVPNLVKRVVFPLEVLPLVIAISSLLSQLVGVVLLLIATVIHQHTLNSTIVFLPLIVLSQLLFTAGFCWFLASLGVYVRDLQHVIALLLSVWMYASPVVYPASRFPQHLHLMLLANPLAGIITDYRRVLLEGLPPDWTHYCIYTAIALFTCICGFLFFYRTKPSFADVM